MNNIARIIRDDFRLARNSIVSVLVLLGLCLVPVVYAWFTITGSWDPHAHAGQLKIAVANSDEGYESALTPVRMNIGDRVVDQLHDNDDYGWVFVNENAAVEGVKSGEYYAAVVIPNDFSRKIMAAYASDAEQPSIQCYLNMKENPIAPLLAGEGEAEVLEDVRAKFTEAVDAMTLDLASDLAGFVDSDNMRGFGARIVSQLDEIASGLDGAADQVKSFSSLTDAAASLTEASSKALTGAKDAADASEGAISTASKGLDDAISAATQSVSRIRQALDAARADGKLDNVGSAEAEKLASDVMSLASSVDKIADDVDVVAAKLQDATDSLAGATGSLASDLKTARNALGIAANKLGASASKVRKFQDDVSAAVAKGDFESIAHIVGNNPTSLAQWLAAPVQVEKHAVYPVANYGSSVAPFFTVLAIWLGAVVLVVVMKTRVSEQRVRRYEVEGGRPVRTFELYLGRFGIFCALSLLQATVVGLGDLFFVRIQCANPMLFLVACWLCALVFANIVYTLAVLFGGVGKALCVVLLVIQIAGSGGEYPIQMMGELFQAVHPFLPFTYGLHAMQESIAGLYGTSYLADLACLAAFILPSLFLGLVIRRPVIRLTRSLGRKLEETGLI